MLERGACLAHHGVCQTDVSAYGDRYRINSGRQAPGTVPVWRRATEMIGQLQGFVAYLLWIGALCLEGFALFDAIRSPDRYFRAAGKLSKNIWLAILGVGLAVIFISRSLFGIVGLAAIIAGIVYLVDVRPALR